MSANNRTGGMSRKGEMVLEKLRHSVGVIVSVGNTRQNILKSVAFSKIYSQGEATNKERKLSSSDMLRFRESNSVKSSPYIK